MRDATLFKPVEKAETFTARGAYLANEADTRDKSKGAAIYNLLTY